MVDHPGIRARPNRFSDGCAGPGKDGGTRTPDSWQEEPSQQALWLSPQSFRGMGHFHSETYLILARAEARDYILLHFRQK